MVSTNEFFKLQLLLAVLQAFVESPSDGFCRIRQPSHLSRQQLRKAIQALYNVSFTYIFVNLFHHHRFTFFFKVQCPSIRRVITGI